MTTVERELDKMKSELNVYRSTPIREIMMHRYTIERDLECGHMIAHILRSENETCDILYTFVIVDREDHMISKIEHEEDRGIWIPNLAEAIEKRIEDMELKHEAVF